MTTDVEIRRAETPENLEAFPERDAYLDWQRDEGVKVIVDFASGVCMDEADALFCPCTAWRSMEAAAELEQRLGRPVVTAVQATAWRTFRKAGITQSIAGNGSLLELMPPVDD